MSARHREEAAREISFRGKRVPTITLEDAHDPGAPAATVELRAEPPPNRAIVRAAVVAAALHALLLLTVGLNRPHSAAPNSAPELRLYVDASGGRDSEQDLAGPVEQPAAPIRKAQEELVASAAPSRAAPAPLPAPEPAATETVTARAAPVDPGNGENPPLLDTAASSGSASGETPAETAAVVSTVGESDREVPGGAPAAPARQAITEEVAGVAMATPQRSKLASWVEHAARSLQDANLTQAHLSLQHDGRRYTAFLERRPPATETGIERVTVEITTEENGKRLRTRLQLKRLAFSHFTQLVDDWDPSVQLHDDSIEGRFHSNTEILVAYDQVAPRFLGRVTTSAVRFTSGHASERQVVNQIFRGGIETRAARIALPANFAALASPPSEMNGKVHSFARPTRVVFYPDGSYGWREIGSSAPERKQAMSAPHYIVGSRGAAICVKGTVSGQVVVYSPERITVEGSLRYAHDAGGDGGDYLGLISSRDVEIAPQSVTGPGDLEVYAAIYAKRRFMVTNEEAPGKATLLIHGSVTAGSLSPTEPRYATHYDYDQRFEQMRPPGFPVTNRYEVEDWDMQWREAKDDLPKADPGSGLM